MSGVIGPDSSVTLSVNFKPLEDPQTDTLIPSYNRKPKQSQVLCFLDFLAIAMLKAYPKTQNPILVVKSPTWHSKNSPQPGSWSEKASTSPRLPNISLVELEYQHLRHHHKDSAAGSLGRSWKYTGLIE